MDIVLFLGSCGVKVFKYQVERLRGVGGLRRESFYRMLKFWVAIEELIVWGAHDEI